MSKTPAEFLAIGVKGVCMGAVEGIPGVSAGTIALITGILQELLSSLQKINITALKTLFKEGPVAAWQYINGTFLLVLFIGLVCGFASLVQVITYGLDNYPIPIWAFFFGLILASAGWLTLQINQWNLIKFILSVLGFIGAYTITVTTPSQLELTTTTTFFGGLIAICAMILPGLSGSFILLLAGLWAPIMQSIKALDFSVIAIFMSGAVVGILGFSHVLSWLFRRFPFQTYAVLIGVMLGSLNRVWPWRIDLKTRINSHGEEVAFLEKSVLPQQFEISSGDPALVSTALIAMAFGIALVFVISKLGMMISSEEMKAEAVSREANEK